MASLKRGGVFAGILVLAACTSGPPTKPTPADHAAGADTEQGTTGTPATSRKGETATVFDSSFALSLRPESPYQYLESRIGSPAIRTGADRYHWDGGHGSALDVVVVADRIHRALVKTPEGGVLVVDSSGVTRGENASDSQAVVASVTAATQAWAQAWSAQDLTAYFNAYARDFHPPGQTHAQWKAQRRQRILAAQGVKVTIVTPTVEVISANHARVSFTQHYASASLDDETDKVLGMWLIEGSWRIVEETVHD